jgi:sec-independent protein translocase protein TatC
MTLIEHLYELRNRLFKAVLGVLIGMIVGIAVGAEVIDFLADPYCQRFPAGECGVVLTGPAAYFLLRLKVGLYVGLIVSAPVWLYQLWAFVAPGLHRHERKWAYGFAAAATPLFGGGVLLAHIVVIKALSFLLPSTEGDFAAQVDLGGYIDFVTGMMLLFGAAFEFPILVFMLNLAGVASATRLLGWWRLAVFACFAFAAIVTPTPDPFGMTALALPMSVLYFAAVGAAFLNEKRRARKEALAGYGDLADDETSPLDTRIDPVSGPDPVEASDPVEATGPVKPSGPVDSSGPVGASGPVDPSGPVEPSGAVSSADPVDSPSPGDGR